MHFAYDILGKNYIIGMFTPINESVWEHSKMLLLPVILWWTVYYFMKNGQYSINKNKWFGGALFALITSLVTMPLVFYFYTEAFGVELLWVDIIILLLSLIFGQLLGLHYYRYGKGVNATVVLGFFTALIVMYMIFTYAPPEIPIFKSN